jgi:hypothetical protein
MCKKKIEDQALQFMRKLGFSLKDTALKLSALKSFAVANKLALGFKNITRMKKDQIVQAIIDSSQERTEWFDSFGSLLF